MVITVVVALYIRVVGQVPGQKCLYRCIRIAGHATEELDSCVSQGCLCAATDTAADEHLCAQRTQYASQSAVPLTAGADHLRGKNFPVLNIIDLEFAGVAEMLEDLAVFICDCDSHVYNLLSVIY